MNNSVEPGIFASFALSLVAPWFFCQFLLAIGFETLFARKVQIVFTFCAIGIFLIGLFMKSFKKDILELLSKRILELHFILLLFTIVISIFFMLAV